MPGVCIRFPTQHQEKGLEAHNCYRFLLRSNNGQVLCGAHNPLGIVARLEWREVIVEAARQFDLVILEDDAYGFMEPEAAPNYAVLAPDRTFYVRGLSKNYAPARRTGFMSVPE